MSKRYPQAVLVSCEAPWDENGELVESVFRDEVRKAISSGFRDLYIFGTAGEGYAVTLTQFREIAGIFREETSGEGVRPMVGVIGMSTAQVVEKVGAAHDIGFRTFQIALPPWGVLTDDEYMTYFTDVCGSFPDSGFLHYNLPRPKRVLGTDDYKRLQDAVPNLVATKFTGAAPAECARLVKETELQHFLGESNFPLRMPARGVLAARLIRADDAEEDAGVLQVRRGGRFREPLPHAGQDHGGRRRLSRPGPGPFDDRRGVRQDDRACGGRGHAAADALARTTGWILRRTRGATRR